jgi:FkbM family methyltransferase
MLSRLLARALDRSAGRAWLARWATAQARQVLGPRVDVRYDGMWLHQLDSLVIPDGPRFTYQRATYASWKDQVADYFKNAEDYWFGEYRPQAGDVIIDVGAGRGEDTLAFSKAVGPTGRVIAIEADPFSYRLLERFCTLNRLDNVQPIQVALMDRPGTVTIAETSSLWEGNTASWSTDNASGNVDAKTLDQLCSELRIAKVDYLKMNIEGAERFALLGGRETIRRIDALCVCAHDFRADWGDGESYRTRAFVEEFLTECGFTLTRRADDQRDYVRDHMHGRRIAA